MCVDFDRDIAEVGMSGEAVIASIVAIEAAAGLRPPSRTVNLSTTDSSNHSSLYREASVVEDGGTTSLFEEVYVAAGDAFTGQNRDWRESMRGMLAGKSTPYSLTDRSWELSRVSSSVYST